MKGIAFLVVAIIVGFIALWGILVAGIASQTETVKRTAQDNAIVTAANSIEFIKRSLVQALTYTFYQSVYENAKNGGHQTTVGLNTIDGFVYWRILSDTSQSPPAPGCTVYNYAKTIVCTEPSGLQSRLIEIFGQYINALQTQSFTIPSYPAMEVQYSTDLTTVQLNAESTDKLAISQQPLFTITDISQIVDVLKTNFYKMIDVGLKNFVYNDPVKQKIILAITKNIPNYSSGMTTAFVKYCPPDSAPGDQSEFTIKYGQNYVQMQQTIASDIMNYIDSITVSTSFKSQIIVSAPANHIYTKITGFFSDDQTQTACTWDANGNATSYYVIRNYIWNYYVSAVAEISMKNFDDVYPVWDGSTDFHNLHLNFAVASCNVNNLTLCNLS